MTYIVTDIYLVLDQFYPVESGGEITGRVGSTPVDFYKTLDVTMDGEKYYLFYGDLGAKKIKFKDVLTINVDGHVSYLTLHHRIPEFEPWVRAPLSGERIISSDRPFMSIVYIRQT